MTAAMTADFAKINRTAAWMMTPYLVWLCFASWLNWKIIVLNAA